MKFSEHQKEIIRGINDGKIFDIHSYLSHFRYIENFKIDKEVIKEKFDNDERGKTYSVLKPGIALGGHRIDPNTHMPQYTRYTPNDGDFYEQAAKLDDSVLTLRVEYEKETFFYNPSLGDGIPIAASDAVIKQFLVIWAFLKQELLVLEFPSYVNKEDMALFLKKVAIEHSNKDDEIEKKLADGYTEISLDSMKEIAKKLVPPLEPPKRNALDFIDEFIEYDNGLAIQCKEYIGKKIVAAPELSLFIKNRFRTQEQRHFLWALIPAYIAIAVSIILPIIQNNVDNKSIEIIRDQVADIQEDSSSINTTLDEILSELQSKEKDDLDRDLLQQILDSINQIRPE